MGFGLSQRSCAYLPAKLFRSADSTGVRNNLYVSFLTLNSYYTNSAPIPGPSGKVTCSGVILTPFAGSWAKSIAPSMST